MNKYRRFKYPFGGETPEEFADARRAYYENISNDAYQQIASGSTPNNIKHIEPNIPGVKDYIERTGQELTDYINRNYNNQPSTRKGKIIRNHDKLYDYYKDGDKLYYRKKGGKNWIDISDNDVAQKRINATIARNKRTYGKPKTSSDEYTPEELRAQGFVQNNKGYWVRPKDLEDSETYDASTLNNVAVKGIRRNKSSNPKRVQGASNYKETPNNQSRYSNVPSDYLLTVLNPETQSYDRITAAVNHMTRNQVKIPEAKVKNWRYYLNHKPQSQPTGARGAVVKAAPSKWRGKY